MYVATACPKVANVLDVVVSPAFVDICVHALQHLGAAPGSWAHGVVIGEQSAPVLWLGTWCP